MLHPSPPPPLQWTSASYVVGMGWDTQERLICVENGQVFIYSIHGEFVAQNNILHDVRDCGRACMDKFVTCHCSHLALQFSNYFELIELHFVIS